MKRKQAPGRNEVEKVGKKEKGKKKTRIKYFLYKEGRNDTEQGYREKYRGERRKERKK